MSFEELKQRQSVMWANGPYQRITETIADIHELVIDRMSVQEGERWLDLACGTGAVAERAARTGADVTGIDLSPGLLETARERAADQGLDIDYRLGDCENLADVDDGAFEIVTSTCGVMFAPDHEATARELARVTKPGGRVALANWEPTSSIAAMFKVMAPFQPAPPPSSPFDWGDEDRARELLGDSFDLVLEHHDSPLQIPTGEDYWELYSTSYGPTKTLADGLGDRREELHRAFVEFAEGFRPNGGINQPREYLLVLGTRR
jgi:SAM-dependent methyltransferase